MTRATYCGLTIKGTVERSGYGGWNSTQPPTCSVEIDSIEADDPERAWDEAVEPRLLYYIDDQDVLAMLRAAFVAHTRRLRLLPEWADEMMRDRYDLREALVKADKEWPPHGDTSYLVIP